MLQVGKHEHFSEKHEEHKKLDLLEFCQSSQNCIQRPGLSANSLVLAVGSIATWHKMATCAAFLVT